jgi:excisionase family DNA binding protein
VDNFRQEKTNEETAMAPLWDKKETAKHLGISTRSLDRLRDKGEIRAVKLGGSIRFRPEDIEATLEKLGKVRS